MGTRTFFSTERVRRTMVVVDTHLLEDGPLLPLPQVVVMVDPLGEVMGDPLVAGMEQGRPEEDIAVLLQVFRLVKPLYAADCWTAI
jgi:hypothetical protein